MSKKSGWVTINISDFDEKEIDYKYERHSPIMLKSTPWLYCRHCGLLYLRNNTTKWCIRMGCLYEYHKDYKRMFYK